ncbi:MAG: winged helix-turn-helix domain-containing protein, partial [Thermoanaerobaculia bacterium]
MRSASRTIQFGDFGLDLQSGELSRNGARVLLPEQPFRILSLLVRNPGTLVTRDDLRNELWPDDTFVDFEHSLNAAVKRLREVLGDSATSPTFIETLPRRGYRFVAPVISMGESNDSEENPGRAPLTKPRRGRLRSSWIGWGITGALLLTAAGPQNGRMDGVHGSQAPLLTRLTSSSGVNLDPALSPDGNLLAYASDRAGSTGTDIWVQPVGGGDPLRLTNHAGDDGEPSFSPDGAQIVFSRRDTGLFVVGAVGGRPRSVVQERWARTPRFSPDGEWVVYWTGFPPSVIAGGIPHALGSIHIVSSGGGAARTLQPRVASARYGIWSPDGKRILFLGEDDVDLKRFDWYITNIDGTELIKTGAIEAIQAAGIRGGPPIPAAWSARDQAVVFATHEVESSSVWQIPISPSTGRVTAPPRPLTSGTASERSPSASATGRVVFSSVVENVDVYRVAVDPESGVATGPLERLTSNTGNDRLRSVTSDGKTMAFISLRTKQDEVWLRDLETGVERQLTYDGASDTTLHPDGSRAAFATASAGENRVDIVDVNSGAFSTLCRGCSIPADWSFDGV